MATEFTLGTAIFDSVDDGIDAIFSSGLGNFAELIAPVIGAGVSLYAVFMAMNWIWSGNTHHLPIGDLMKRMAFMALFTLYAFNIGYYKSSVVDPVNSIGAEISEAFASTGASAPQVIDQMGNQIIDTITLIWENSPEMSITSLNIAPLFQAILAILVVGVLGTIFMAISMLYLLIAKLLVALVLCLGPLFISFAFFPVTREFFMKWLSQLMNYVLLSAMFGITFTLLTNLLQSYVTGSGFSDVLVGNSTLFKLIFCYVLFTGVIMAIPSLTSQLTGGVGINSLGAVGPLASAAGRAMSSAMKSVSNKSSSSGSGNRISGAGGANRRLG